MSEPLTGRGIDRVDARQKVTGQATYAAEVAVANVAHAVIVSSTIARGKVTSFDTRAAEQLPGVLAVLTPRNAPKLPAANKKNGPIERVLQLLQDDEVLYNDQPIALVVADTLERAQHAAELLTVRYEAGAAAVADLEADLGSAYVPAKAGPAGDSESRRGDVEAGLAAAKVKVEATYTTPIENHNPMEPHASTVIWEGDGRLTVYDKIQGVMNSHAYITGIFGLDADQVHVLSPFVGGAFGSHARVGVAVAQQVADHARQRAVAGAQLQLQGLQLTGAPQRLHHGQQAFGRDAGAAEVREALQRHRNHQQRQRADDDDADAAVAQLRDEVDFLGLQRAAGEEPRQTGQAGTPSHGIPGRKGRRSVAKPLRRSACGWLRETQDHPARHG